MTSDNKDSEYKSATIGNVKQGVFFYIDGEDKPHLKTFGISKETAAYMLVMALVAIIPEPTGEVDATKLKEIL